jgi:hypothetical protein
MEGQFNVEFDLPMAPQEDFTSFPTLDFSSVPPSSHFAGDIHSLLGEEAEPDPLFFVESWTLGAPTAAENLKQRRSRQDDFQPQTHNFGPSNQLGAEFFVQQSQQYAQVSSPRSAYREGFAAHSYQTSQDKSEPFTRESESSQQPNQPMTRQLALQILGVTATSSAIEIKSAYRRLVNEWHPDRFECQTERARQLATAKMSAINKAYQFLRTTL